MVLTVIPPGEKVVFVMLKRPGRLRRPSLRNLNQIIQAGVVSPEISSASTAACGFSAGIANLAHPIMMTATTT
jgi:hypothetical protein